MKTLFKSRTEARPMIYACAEDNPRRAGYLKVGFASSDGAPVANLLHFGDHCTGGYLTERAGFLKRYKLTDKPKDEIERRNYRAGGEYAPPWKLRV